MENVLKKKLFYFRDKELADLQNIGRKLADFLQIPLVSEIGMNGEINTKTTSFNSETSPHLKSIETEVEKFYKTLKSNYGQTHEYRIVNSDDFRGYVDLDLL